MTFRFDINALRALAVSMVVLFHFFPNFLPAGFAGVDIFFVVSGYLMASIILTSVNNKKFSLLAFYLARAKRIVPALLVLVMFLLIFGWFVLLPTDYLALAKQAFSSLAFLSNVLFWREAGYFTSSAHEKWLLHTWSLSVEWQFYILFPILLITLVKFFSFSTMRILLSALALCSFLFSLYLSYFYADQAYYMVYSRAWQMLAGALIYLLPKANLKGLHWLGLCLIGIGVLGANTSTAWPGYMSLLPVLGTCFIIYAQATSKLFMSPAVMWLGEKSYSIYLWHWPVVVYLNYEGLYDNSAACLIGVGVSLLFGFLSFRLVENHQAFKNKFLTLKGAFLVVLPALIFSAAVVYFKGVTHSIRPVSLSEKAKFIELYQHKLESLSVEYWLKCNAHKSYLDTGFTDVAPECIASSDKPVVLLWGDSHAEALSYGIRNLLDKEYAFNQITSSGCRPSLLPTKHLSGELKLACDASNQRALEVISKNKPKIVVLAQANFHHETDWSEISARVKTLGVEKVILLGPVPQWRPSLPSVIVHRHWGSEEAFIEDRGFDASVIVANNEVQKQLLGSEVEFIDLLSKLCIQTDSNFRCRARLESDQSLLVVDYGHLSLESSLFVVESFLLNKLRVLSN